MNLNQSWFRQILADLRSENPLACQGILSLAGLEFTDAVPTLAVTLGERSVLQVNLGFLREHARGEDDVKAVLLHEFLHVLLRHTARIRTMTPLRNLALDAIINATIHRLAGPRFSDFFSHYYAGAQGIARLLRSPTPNDPPDPFLDAFTQALHQGKVSSDDAYAFVCDPMHPALRLPEGRLLLGNHDERGFPVALEELPPGWGEVLRHCLETPSGRLLNGQGGALSLLDLRPAALNSHRQWHSLIQRVFASLALPDQRGRRLPNPEDVHRLPVLHPADRRAVLRTLWNPLLPDAHWPGGRPRPTGTVHLYLDVSGSMSEHLRRLLQALVPLQAWLRRPIWAFSTCVTRAEFRDGKLRATTTGGTCLTCVLDHLVRIDVRRAVLVTDGIVGAAPPALCSRLKGRRIEALILPGGTDRDLNAAGIPTHLLS